MCVCVCACVHVCVCVCARVCMYVHVRHACQLLGRYIILFHIKPINYVGFENLSGTFSHNKIYSYGQCITFHWYTVMVTKHNNYMAYIPVCCIV